MAVDTAIGKKTSKSTKNKTVTRKKTKKKTAKRPTSAAKLRQIKKNVEADKQFILVDGNTLKSLRELAKALGTMSDDVFYYHVNDSKNDFACWIKDVVQDNELADQINMIRQKNDFELHLLRSIVKLI